MTTEELCALFPVDDLGNNCDFEFDESIGKFVGHIINRQFRGLTIANRQEQVWETIRHAFGEEASQVSLVLTFTPEEWDEVGDEAASA